MSQAGKVAVAAGWFALAAYVLARLLTADVPLDGVLAAWLGGVLSVPLYLTVRDRLRSRS